MIAVQKFTQALDKKNLINCIPNTGHINKHSEEISVEVGDMYQYLLLNDIEGKSPCPSSAFKYYGYLDPRHQRDTNTKYLSL